MSEESVVLGRLTDPTWRVIEVGGGGSPTPWPADRYVNVDRTPAGVMGSVGSQSGVVSTATHCAEMDALPFDDETFDALVGRHVLEHHADTLMVLREWRRVLRPGGKLVVVCPDQATYPSNTVLLDDKHRAAFTPEQLAALARHAGFTDIETAEAHPQWSFVLSARRG